MSQHPFEINKKLFNVSNFNHSQISQILCLSLNSLFINDQQIENLLLQFLGASASNKNINEDVN